jgi:hypothetical protein
MHDALFRTNSAVILPEGEDPNSKPGSSQAVTTVGLFATVLRYNEEHPSHVTTDGTAVRKKLLIAGHTDTQGKDADNQKLSEERAQVALSLLSFDRDKFAKLCQKRHDGVDLTQVFHWVADSLDFEFDCKPTLHDQPPSTTSVTRFKTAYNAAFDAKFASINGAKKFGTVNGTQDEALWGAIFDCYEYGLCCELGDMETSTEGQEELKRLRSELTWVDDKHKTMGFGEKFPVDNATKNNYRSQSNRRVEIMMFDEGEEPDLTEAATNPEVMETYLPGAYGKVAVKPMVTARLWKAEWDELSTGWMDDRKMLLAAPVLPAGETVVYDIWVTNAPNKTKTAGLSSESAAEASWCPGKDDVFSLGMGDGPYHLYFAAVAGGRRVTCRQPLLLFEYNVAVRTLTRATIANEAVELASDDEVFRRRIPVALGEALGDGRTLIRFGSVLPAKRYTLTYLPCSGASFTVFSDVPIAQIHSHGSEKVHRARSASDPEPQVTPPDTSDFDPWLL